MIRRRDTLAPAEARRAVLAAQGFATTGTEASPGRRQLLAGARRLGVLQIDSVHVLSRAHYLPLFSRLGPYDRGLLDDLAARRPRHLFEYWAHEASLVPVSYTHLTLRTSDLVWFSVVAVSLKKKNTHGLAEGNARPSD